MPFSPEYSCCRTRKAFLLTEQGISFWHDNEVKWSHESLAAGRKAGNV